MPTKTATKPKTRQDPPAITTGGLVGQEPGVTTNATADTTGSTAGGATVCPSCRREAPRLIASYWGPELCPDCCAAAVAEMDEAASWPAPWWEYPCPPHLAVYGAQGLWRCGEPMHAAPMSISALGQICEDSGIDQVWVHVDALARLKWPWSILGSERQGWACPFTEERGQWRSGSSPALKPWSYWYKKGGWGFDLHTPTYGRSVWRDVQSAPELLARVAMFDHATKGVPWKGNGTITSDVYLRRRLGKRLQPTELPDPCLNGSAHEVPTVWHRPARAEESRLRYCHGLDLNLAYAAGASSLALPAGPCEHVDWPSFDPGLAGVYHVEEGDTSRWVTAPTYQRLETKGIVAMEGWVWPDSKRRLRPWYEMIRDARAELLADGGVALLALKDVCREGLGRLASKVRTLPEGKTHTDDPTYQPYWSWAVIAEVRERLADRVAGLELEPVAIDTDCLYFLSSKQSPASLGASLGLPLGDGLGQFKPAGTCLGVTAREILSEKRSSRAVAALREAMA